MKSVAGIVIFIALFSSSPGLAADTPTEISNALDYYAEMWNEGDIDSIGAYYHQDFVLVTDSGAIASGKRVDDLKAIARAGEDRGKMKYSNVTIKPLEDKHAIAYGQLDLKFRDGSNITAWFTTVYVKTPFGWKALLTHN